MCGLMDVDGGHIFAEKRCVWNSRQQIFFPNSFGYKDPYFKYRGEGSQIFWIYFVILRGAVGQGAV